MIDSTRRPQFECPDCATDNMVATALPEYCEDGTDGALVVVVHSSGCPWFAALPEDDRYQPDDHGVVHHFTIDELPTQEAER